MFFLRQAGPGGFGARLIGLSHEHPRRASATAGAGALLGQGWVQQGHQVSSTVTYEDAWCGGVWAWGPERPHPPVCVCGVVMAAPFTHREFIATKLVPFAERYPHVTFQTKLKRNVHPFVRAEYGACGPSVVDTPSLRSRSMCMHMCGTPLG
jgi:hypothetical protein